jgi:Nif-specific regulatory protein
MMFDKLKKDHIESLYRLVQSLSRSDNTREVLDQQLKMLKTLTGAENAAFIHYNSNANAFETVFLDSSEGLSLKDFKTSRTVLNQVVETRETQLFFDSLEESELSQSESIALHHIHAIIALPLMIDNSVYGIMYFDSRQQRQNFTEPTRQLTEFFAPFASVLLEQAIKREAAQREYDLIKNEVEVSRLKQEIIGQSEPMRRLLKMVSKIAKTDNTVLITGENGTGKDLIARAIHDLSPRAENAYHAQYIGSIPKTMLESELYGHAKGAFTGASSAKEGIFEAAGGGTIFLDEIADLPMELQVSLLRTLQNREVKRLGETKIRKIDVRLIAATNQDLAEKIKNGTFREDLYYRLNVIHLHIPPLRERKADIPLLARHFVQLHDSSLSIESAALKKLESHRWPGNIRQLQNTIKRACIFADDGRIKADDIQLEQIEEEPFAGTLEDYKNKLIEERLAQFDGNRSQAARSLDVSLRYLQNKAKELGL